MGWFFFVGPSFAYADDPIPVEQVIVESATATIQQAETTTAIITTQAQSLIDPSPVISAVETATATISDAKVALSQYETATATLKVAQDLVETATATVELKQDLVETATATYQSKVQLVDSQTAVVASDQLLVDSATAVVNANTSPGLKITVYDSTDSGASPTLGEGTIVYTGTDTNGINEQWGSGGPTVNGATTTITTTETFAENHLNTDIGITVNGTTVSTTNNSGVYIGSIGFPGPGQDPSLSFYSASSNTLVTLPANTTAASFDVFAKNGNSTGTITYSDGTTESFIIQDDVNANYPNYVHKETFTAPAGKTISTILVPADWDYYAIDNVSATKTVTSTTTITEDFQVKWEGIWTPQTTGTQYIYAPADDGVVLKLDGEVVINDWVDKGGGGSTADVQTTAGLAKLFEMWYYENGGGAAVALKRYTGSGWEVIPASEFSTTTATTAQKAALASAKTQLTCLLYTSPSPRDLSTSRMPSSA